MKSGGIKGKNQCKVVDLFEILNLEDVKYLHKNAFISLHLYQCIIITRLVVKIRVCTNDVRFPSPVDHGSIVDFHKLEWCDLLADIRLDYRQCSIIVRRTKCEPCRVTLGILGISRANAEPSLVRKF